jgi:hypothetical protein
MIYPGDRRLARLHLAQGSTARAFELDPSLRPSLQKRATLALDAAIAFDAAIDATISRAVRKATRAAVTPRRSTRVTSIMRSSRSSHGFDAAALFQKDEHRDSSQPTRRSYGDPDADPKAAAHHIGKAMNHVNAVDGGQSEFNAERLRKYLQDALDALHAGDEADEAAEEPQADDGVGETEARSVVTTKGPRRNPDHRKDFNSMKQGGADGALAFDANGLFQRGER